MALGLGLGASAWALREGRRVRVRQVEVVLRKLPAAFDGLRVVQLSDLHVGPTSDRRFVEEVVARVNALAPDVVAITGDLIHGRVFELEAEVAPLAALRSTHGTFVTGNHEYHVGVDVGAPNSRPLLLGVRVLRNERVTLSSRAGHALDLAGVDDEGADLAAALAGRDPVAAAVLADQPREARAARHHVDLQLSGHTHGGQLWPLGWLLRAGQPAIAGLSRVADTPALRQPRHRLLGPAACGLSGVPAEITKARLAPHPPSRDTTHEASPSSTPPFVTSSPR